MLPNTRRRPSLLLETAGTTIFAVSAMLGLARPAAAGPVTLFSTGNPDGRIATLSRPASGALPETETADDFVLGTNALITGATLTGLVPVGTSLSTLDAAALELELYHIFPVDSTNPPDLRVPTRTNSPSDVAFASLTTGSGDISFTPTILSPSFTTSNSVVNDINPVPNERTGGEGAVTGEEVLFTITFATPLAIGATDHDFFSPEVGLSSGNFLWLSAPKPIVFGTPFTPDLQAWIRNANLDPDWLRIGTDIVGGTPPPNYNMAFSLIGTTVSEPTPEPATLTLTLLGLSGVVQRCRRRRVPGAINTSRSTN